MKKPQKKTNNKECCNGSNSKAFHFKKDIEIVRKLSMNYKCFEIKM